MFPRRLDNQKSTPVNVSTYNTQRRDKVHGERANFRGPILGGGGGRPDYLQKLKVPEEEEKKIDDSNI